MSRDDADRAGVPDLIYVLASGHSGSSLLDFLLGLDEGVVSSGEVHRLCLEPSTRLCSCGVPLDRCEHWQGIRSHLESVVGRKLVSWADWEVSLAPRGLGESLAWRLITITAPLGLWGSRHLAFAARYLEMAHRSWLLYRSMAATTGGTVVVDSTKNPLRLLALAKTRPPSASLTIVHLHRDGRAVAALAVRRRGISWLRAAAEWRVTQAKHHHALRALRGKALVHVLRYEDLCVDPLRTVNELREAVGLPRLDALSGFDNQDSHLVPGNPMLLSGVTEIAMDNRWRNDAGRLARVASALFIDRLNRSRGYDEGW